MFVDSAIARIIIAVPKSMESTIVNFDETSSDVNPWRNKNMNATPIEATERRDDHRDSRSEKAAAVLSVLSVFAGSILALFLASIALLCWSANALFIAVTSGPNLDMENTSALSAMITPASALIIVAISLMMIRHLEKDIDA